MSVLDDFPVELTCDQCGSKFEKTVGWLKAHDQLACPSCGDPTTIDEPAKQTLAAAEQGLVDFQGAIRAAQRRLRK